MLCFVISGTLGDKLTENNYASINFLGNTCSYQFSVIYIYKQLCQYFNLVKTPKSHAKWFMIGTWKFKCLSCVLA